MPAHKQASGRDWSFPAESAADGRGDRSIGVDLIEAVEEDNYEGLEEVLKEEPECGGQECASGAVLLHIAAEEGNVELLELLLPHTPEPTSIHDASGATPLHYAARCGHVDVISALLPKLSNTLAVDKAGSTAMHHAAGNGQQGAVKALLGAPDGAQAAQAKTRCGQTPSSLAKLCGFRDISKLLASAMIA
jgi:ankyrin repeat protein